MKQIAVSQLFVGSITLYSLLVSPTASAQITTDGTTSTTVDANGNNFTINDGDRAGGNLFHSFDQFGVPTGGEAFFNNAPDVENIINRVTGGNISNIDGLIRANGSANLFLLNPAGIIFGPNARLNIGGSFFGSTADSLLFDDGTEFSATETQTPLLTINAPIGLNLRDNPQPITNRSVADGVGLQVNAGESITLVGGDLNFDEGRLTAPGGRVELGGLSEAGEIGINNNGSLTFPNGIERADVTLTNFASVNVTAGGGGFINVNAKNLILSGQSELFAGIAEDMGSPNAVAGDITINATESVRLIGNPRPEDLEISNVERDTATGIRNNVGLSSVRRNDGSSSSNAMGNGGSIIINTETLELTNITVLDTSLFGEGNAGNITIDADSLEATNGGVVNANTVGQGDAGDITINATDSISLDSSRISSEVDEIRENNNAVGNAGNITLTTRELNLVNAEILSTSFARGDAGDITIDASVRLVLDNNSNIRSNLNDLSSGIFDAIGNGGDITIDTGSLDLTNGASIDVSTSGIGDVSTSGISRVGNITIDATDVSLDQSSQILSQIREMGKGEGGRIEITADNISLKESSLLSTDTAVEATGDAGNIILRTRELNLVNNSEIISTSFARGDSGDITIDASDISLDSSRILSQLDDGQRDNNNAVGNAGNITLTTRELNLVNAEILSTSFAQGDAGDITIDASVRLVLDNSNIRSNLNDLRDGNFDAIGNGGDITIDTGSLDLTNGASIDVSTSGIGDVSTSGISRVGNITIDATDVSLDQSSQILSQIREMGKGEGGRIEITADNISLKESSLLSTDTAVEATGNAGNIILDADDVSLENQSQILSQIRGNGEGGRIEITADNIISLQEFSRLSTSTGVEATGDAGNIILDADTISITEGAIVDGITENDSNGGNITITARVLEIASGGKVITSTDGNGNAGNITLNIADQIDVNGSNAPSRSPGEQFDEERLNELETQTGLFASTSDNSTGDGGSISIGVFQPEGNNLILDPNQFTEEITVADEARIAADSQGEGNGGRISIRAEDLALNNQAEILAETRSEQDDSTARSEINLELDGILRLENDSRISTQAFSNADGGNINIDADFIIARPGQNEGSDILTRAEQEGAGGDININAEQIFGIEEREAISGNGTNDIDASSEFGLSGNVSINTLDVNAIQGTTELPDQVISPETFTAQACNPDQTAEDILADRESSFTVTGRGGLPSMPTDPLTSDAILREGEFVTQEEKGNSATEAEGEDKFVTIVEQTEPVNIDEIVPARGMIVKENGVVILTAYPTPNAASRNPDATANCNKY